MFVGLLGYVLIDRRSAATSPRPVLAADWLRFREIFRLGLPIGVTLIMEVGLFAGSGFLIG